MQLIPPSIDFNCLCFVPLSAKCDITLANIFKLIVFKVLRLNVVFIAPDE